MKLGLVTYKLGRDWDVPTLIKHCAAARFEGVELRSTHAHKVEADLSPARRAEVRKQFEDSPVELYGLGTAFEFQSPDPATLQKNIDGTKAYVRLAADVGAMGIKVRPNGLPRGVPEEKTLEQIGRAYRQVAQFGADHGVQLWMEVHGRSTSHPARFKKIIDVADHPNVTVCWNSNAQDLDGEGLRYNFDLVKDRFGKTAHVREFNVGDYPYQELIDLFVEMGYDGWVLLEARTEPMNRVEALAEQRVLFEQMLAKALRSVKAG